MKALIIVALLMTALYPQTYVINTEKSSLTWQGEKLTGKHNGSLKVKSGTVTIKDNIITGGKVEADMTTIQDFDIEDEEYRTKLENHLKSTDFFGADSFPVAVFRFKSGIPIEKDTYIIKGDMLIKGISNPVEFKATILINKKSAGAKGTLTLDRTKWNVRYNSSYFFPNIGDKIIYDNFTVGFDLTADQKQ